MIIDINEYFNLKDYKVKNLKKGDIYDIQNLCERCSDYFCIDQGSGPDRDEGRKILEILPPQKGIRDKFVLGVYNTEKRLIGLIDIVKNYPTENEWMLGFLLIDPDERNKGLGKLLHNALIYWVRNEKGKKIRIGVLNENEKAFRFWSSLGYKLINKNKLQRKGKEDKEILVMNYYL